MCNTWGNIKFDIIDINDIENMTNNIIVVIFTNKIKIDFHIKILYININFSENKCIYINDNYINENLETCENLDIILFEIYKNLITIQ